MSTSLLTFLSLLETEAQPLLPARRTWRFQRLINLSGREAVLQLWEDFADSEPPVLNGQVNLREAVRGQNAGSSFSGTVQSAAAGGEIRPFSFHPISDAEVERQARQVAEQWARSINQGAQ